MEKIDTTLYANDDVEILKTVLNRFGIPFSVGRNTQCYLMQEDRIVFIGTRKRAISFIEHHKTTNKVFPSL